MSHDPFSVVVNVAENVFDSLNRRLSDILRQFSLLSLLISTSLLNESINCFKNRTDITFLKWQERLGTPVFREKDCTSLCHF